MADRRLTPYRLQQQEDREARGQRYVTALERGTSTAQLAAQDGITHQAVTHFLRGMGLPSSVRQAVRAKTAREAEAKTPQGLKGTP